MANARQLMASRTAISTAPAEMEMTANELLEIMCANSSDNKASLYNDNIESVSPGLFWNATSIASGNNNWLEEIVLPNCTSVAFRAFYRCSALKRLILPALTSCSYASSFQYLSSIEELDIGNVVSTGTISLTGANVNGFTIYIRDGYYSEATTTASLLTIPSTVTGPVKIVFNGSKVGDKILYGSTHQVDVEILDSVTSIGNYCFENCTGLTQMTIPNSVTSIGTRCFRGCTGLTSVTVPDSVISIGNLCFGGCTGLTSAGPIGGDYDYKFGWRNEIPPYAFYGCTGLTSVTLPESVTSLGISCFEGCTARIDIYGPIRVATQGSYTGDAFGSCEVHLHFDSIPSYAFINVLSQFSVVLEEPVTSLGMYCFNGCTGLTSITSRAIVPPMDKYGSNTFYDVDKSIPVYVPAGSVAAYKAATGWSEFTNIQAIPETS